MLKSLKSAYLHIYSTVPARKIVCNLYLLSWTWEKVVNLLKSFKIFKDHNFIIFNIVKICNFDKINEILSHRNYNYSNHFQYFMIFNIAKVSDISIRIFFKSKEIFQKYFKIFQEFFKIFSIILPGSYRNVVRHLEA